MTWHLQRPPPRNGFESPVARGSTAWNPQSARDLLLGDADKGHHGLGYSKWQNGAKVVRRAMKMCRVAEHEPADHFTEVSKMVALGSGAAREVRPAESPQVAPLPLRLLPGGHER